MDEREIKGFSVALKTGSCVLFIGPDLAQVKVPPELKIPKVPATEEDTAKEPEFRTSASINDIIAAKLHGQLRNPGETALDAGLAHIAQLFLWDDRETRGTNTLISEMLETYEEFEGKTSDLHRKIASLPFHTCISTAHDDFLVNAFKECGKDPQVEYFDINAPRNTSDKVSRDPQKPFFYRLNGCVEDPFSMVITEDDLIDYLIKIAKNGFPHQLAELIKDQTTVFLFLGFGLYHWHLRILLRVLDQERKRKNVSFALEGKEISTFRPAYLMGKRSEAQVFYKYGHKIKLLESDPNDILDRLVDQFSGKAGKTGIDTRKASSNGADSHARQIFISYTRRDLEREDELSCGIEELEEALSAEYRIWRDKASLRGGDEWEARIKDAIRDSDYFLFLESTSTEPPDVNRSNPVEAYWRIELQEALDRNRRYPSNFNYMIPVRLEKCYDLPELKNAERVDLFEEGGLDRLLRSLREDTQLRERESR